MRDELMTEALCWQFETKITAEYAYATNTTFELACYCPHETCLVRVHAKKRVNTYFYAPDKHVAGCPNEARTTESALHPGAPKPRTADEPAKPMPNLLGPGPTIKQKSVAPTTAELLQLAARVRTLPARHPGTLEEVIDAWTSMTPSERALQPLTVGDFDLTYETAFTFLGNAADDIDSLNPLERIIYGAAAVVEKEHCFLIQSRKTFLHGTGKLPLRLVPKKRNLVLNYLPTLINQKATLFWHGVVPELADKRNAFRFEIESSSPYAGMALRLGELLP